MSTPAAGERARRRDYAVGSLLFFCSGATGLAYEVIWFKRFSHVWGNSTLATATVVASFLSGLGLGAAWLGRAADRSRSPFRWYGIFEAAIGVLALLVPLAARAMVTWVAPVVAPLHATPLLHSLARFGLTFLVVGPPCILMGGTLPMLVRQFGGTAWLYAVNTLGAAVGCYLTGFHLLPSFGLAATNAGAAALNLSIAFVVLAVLRPGAPLAAAALEAPPGPLADEPPAVGAVFVVAALTGAAALVLQLVWSRQLALILGGSTYAFTAMLVVILVGIGVGSFVLHPWLGDRVISPGPPAAVIAVTMLAVALGQLGIGGLTDLLGVVSPLRAAQTVNAFVCVTASAVLELLPALGMGIMFPMFIALAGTHAGGRGASVGAIYAWNTLGTIAGAVATPLVLMPALGTARCVTLALGLYGVAVGLLLLRRSGAVWRVAIPAVAVAGLVVSLAGWNADPRDTHLGAYLYGTYTAQQKADRQPVFFAEGGATSVLVVRTPDGQLALHVNGKVDATSGPDMPMQLGLAYLPRFLRPAARQVLVIGMGSGTTAGASVLFPDTDVTAIEIEPAIAEAARQFAAVNHRPEASPRFHLVVDDGRSFVQGTQDTYDLILSEPSNPWIAGVSNLFTREFYEIASRHLGDDGVFAQWVQLYALDPADYALILRTIMAVFPHVGLFQISGSDTVLVASRAPLDGGAAMIRASQALVDASPEIDADLTKWFGTRSVLSLLVSRLLLDQTGIERLAGAIGGQGVNTDVNMRLEFDAPSRLFGAGRLAEINHAIMAAGDPTWFADAFARWGGRPDQAAVFHSLAVSFAQYGATGTATALSAHGYDLNPAVAQLAGDVFAGAAAVPADALEHLVGVLVEQAPARATQLADGLVRSRRAERALPVFERLTALHPHSAVEWMHLAQAYRALGRTADAAQAIRTAYDLDPFNDAVAEEYGKFQAAAAAN